MAPLALLAGVRTVREAVEHPRLSAFLRRLLFDEIIPATNLPGDAAHEFAQSVVERFRNPWLEHEWRVILTNQETKMRIRVVPLIVSFGQRRERAPGGLALACAAHLALLKLPVDSLAEASRLPDFVEATTRWMRVLEREGVEAALAGATAVKLFPAWSVGARYLQEVLAPLRFLRVVPAGGVTRENAGEWIQAGAAAVSVGGALVTAALVREAAWPELTRRARALVDAVAAARP